MSGFQIFLVVVFLIVLFIGIRYFSFVKASKRAMKIKFERVVKLYELIEKNKTITVDDVYPYAKEPSTRESTFQLLKRFDLSQFFPEDFFTIIKAAESNLVNWLEFPTELDAVPDEIEYVKRVTIDFDGNKNFVHYEVFKFRTNPPHWASESGWMLGVVGPYFDESKPYDFPGSTFSRMSASNKISPDEEAKWVHENISKRKHQIKTYGS